MLSVLEGWGAEFTTFVVNLGSAILTLVVGWLAAKFVARALGRLLGSVLGDRTLASFCSRLSYVTMLTLVVIWALHRLGFPAMSFAAVLGAAGLAIGLALKNTLSNFAAGVILIALRPFKVGDRIDAAGVSGLVSEIRIFATTLASEDGKTIIVPNAAIVGGNISTYSTGK